MISGKWSCRGFRFGNDFQRNNRTLKLISKERGVFLPRNCIPDKSFVGMKHRLLPAKLPVGNMATSRIATKEKGHEKQEYGEDCAVLPGRNGN